MSNKTDIHVFEYDANAGFGVVFKSKSILIKGESFDYIVSPKNFTKEEMAIFSNDEARLIFIAPNNFHNLYLKVMKEKYPNAQFFGPKRRAKQSGVELKNTKNLPSGNDLIPIYIAGNNTLAETCFFHEASKTMIITDLLFNMHHKMNFPTMMAMKLAQTYKCLNMSRLLRSSIKDKKKFKISLNQLLEYPFETVILNHGDNITREQFVAWLKKEIV